MEVMIDKIKELIAEAEAFKAQTKEEVETFRIKYLGKKGLLNEYFSEFKNVANDQKKEFGQAINKLKQTAQDKVNQLKEELENNTQDAGVSGDLSRPGEPLIIGSRHPISIVKNQIIDIFSNIGFNVSEGPEIEDDWHNFTALNLPEYHPARDMQDTFFIQTNPDILLRIPVLYKYVTWKIINRQYVLFHQEEYTVTKQYLQDRTVFFIK